ncbi:MAG: MFS transporter [Gammaproteobacteria bacterium]
MPSFMINLFSFSGRIKILHMSWMAFFISFMVWFNHAPLMLMIMENVHLTEAEVNIILLLNVASTIPARVIIGIVVDHFGARISFSALLALCSLPCFAFAFADTFEQLAWARFFLGFVGAGFVVGIRMIGDWFPNSQVGVAEGVYGGWGNLGSAVGIVVLPGLALWVGTDEGWRYAIAATGFLALVYSVIYYRHVVDTPPDCPYLKPKHSGALEVTSIHDLFLYILTTLPLYAAMSLLTWRLSTTEAGLLPDQWLLAINIVIWLLFILHAYRMVDINADRLSRPIESINRYRFKQVTVLSMAYFMAFGSKLAVVSMLPIFFFTSYREIHPISMLDAGLLASSFICMNLIARPAGGWLSDKIGRKIALLIAMMGMALGYYGMSFITSDWSLVAAVLVTVVCSVFVQAAEGAVFAIVPLINRRITGQIAGIAGAYGNAGAIFFLTLLTFVGPATFFTLLAICALFTYGIILFLDEPKEFITEIMPDGSLIKIELD